MTDSKNKQKRKLQAQNDVDSLTVGVTERILKNITDLYLSGSSGIGGGAASAVGLKQIAEDQLLGLSLHTPRKKVSVMVVGNHSAGKSSFINWYVGETIQKTGVAIETKGFYFLTSGKKRDTLKGDATLFFFDHLKGFEQFDGVVPNLFTEVSTSKEKNFPCVDFIDTPGLVDGDIHYPYDVDAAMEWLADHVDLILVFFDPIGQALTARTMNVIERLSTRHSEKLKFYMSKADQVEREDDRQRVLIQITQNITARIKVNHAFALPTFYLPHTPDDPRPPSAIPNAIEEVCEEIDKAIKLTVQKNLTSLKGDCQTILKRIEEVHKEDQRKRAINGTRRSYGLMLWFFIWMVIATGLLLLVRQVITLIGPLADLIDSTLHKYPDRLEWMHDFLGLKEVDGKRLLAMDITDFYRIEGTLFVVFLLLYITSKLVWKYLPVLTKRDQSQLRMFRTYVEGVSSIRDSLYKDYFKQLQNSE